MKPLIEEWKSIEGFDNYEVSNFGQVRSLDRQEWLHNRHENPYLRKRKGKILSQHMSNVGYMQVALYINGKMYAPLVHRLVAKAFIDNPNNFPEVNHEDGNKLNNSIENLNWCTRTENSLHSTKVLNKNKGENSGMSLLTEEQVLNILSQLDLGVSQTKLGEQFNVTNHTIHKIYKRKNWCEVSHKYDMEKERRMSCCV